MENIRNLQDIEKQLTNYMDDYKLELELWGKVELLKKKDGSSFANMNKSFNNCKYGCERWSDMMHPCVFVYGTDHKHGWREFKLDAFLYLDDMKKAEDPRYTDQPLIVNSFVRNTYLLTDDEIFKRIKDRMRACESAIIKYDKMIRAAAVEYDGVVEHIDNLKKAIKAACDPFKEGIYDSSLYYAFRELAKYQINY